MSTDNLTNERMSMSAMSGKGGGSPTAGIPGIMNRGNSGGLPPEPPPPNNPRVTAGFQDSLMHQPVTGKPLGAAGIGPTRGAEALRGPALPPAPSSGMSVQSVISPSHITPNDGVRVDNGVNPSPGKPGLIPPAMPNNEEVGKKPVQNSAPEKQSSTATGKKTSFKTILIGCGAGAAVILIIILCIMAKGNKDKIEEAQPDASQSEDAGDLVQDFEEYEDPFGIVPGDDWIIETFTYTETELANLRRVGYTGTEIEAFQAEERPAQELIEEAEQARKEYLDETIKPYYDARSDEFKKVEQDTWLGLPSTDEEQLPVTPEQLDSFNTVNKTINTDFEKVTPRGNQLFLKIYLDDEHTNWIYYQCSPAQWSMLKPYGNLVVDVKVLTYQSEEKYYEWWQAVGISIY